MRKIRNISFGIILGGLIGFFAITPLAYGIAHGAEFLLFIPIFTGIIGGIGGLCLGLGNQILKNIGYFLSISLLIGLGAVMYIFVVEPRISSSRIIVYVTKIQPDSFEYSLIRYGGKSIGVNINAKFSMNPDLQDIIPHSQFPELPYVSYNLYGYPRLELIQVGKNFILSGVALVPPIAIDGNQQYCLSKYSNISTGAYQKGIFTGNLIYPYFEGSCFRGGDCITSYEIPKTDIILDFDPTVFIDLSTCAF